MGFLPGGHEARALMRKDKPFMLTLSPMCGPFSSIQGLFSYPGRPVPEVRQRLADGLAHVRFALEFCIEQQQAGRLFMFEHPAGAST